MGGFQQLRITYRTKFNLFNFNKNIVTSKSWICHHNVWRTVIVNHCNCMQNIFKWTSWGLIGPSDRNNEAVEIWNESIISF